MVSGMLVGSATAAFADMQGEAVAYASGAVRDDLPMNRAGAIPQIAKNRAWTGEAIREFHAPAAVEPTGRTGWSADAVRELKAGGPTAVERPFSAEVMRELKATGPTPGKQSDQPFTGDVLRELKGGVKGAGGSR